MNFDQDGINKRCIDRVSISCYRYIARDGHNLFSSLQTIGQKIRVRLIMLICFESFGNIWKKRYSCGTFGSLRKPRLSVYQKRAIFVMICNYKISTFKTAWNIIYRYIYNYNNTFWFRSRHIDLHICVFFFRNCNNRNKMNCPYFNNKKWNLDHLRMYSLSIWWIILSKWHLP